MNLSLSPFFFYISFLYLPFHDSSIYSDSNHPVSFSIVTFSNLIHTYFSINSTIFLESPRPIHPFCFPFLRPSFFALPLFSYLVPNHSTNFILILLFFFLIHIFTVIEFHSSHLSFLFFVLFISSGGHPCSTFFFPFSPAIFFFSTFLSLSPSTGPFLLFTPPSLQFAILVIFPLAGSDNATAFSSDQDTQTRL